METPKPKRPLFRWMPILGIVAVVGASLMFMVCAISDGAVEANIAALRVEAEKLRQNPQDKQSLSVLLKQLTHRNRMYRINAAAVLGEAAEGADNVSAAIAPEAVPALAKMLNEGNDFDQRAAASALERFGKHAGAALPVLRKKLTPSDYDIAWYSADTIRNIGSPAAEALPELMGALKEQLNRCQGYFSPCSRSFIPAIGAIGPAAINAKPELELLLEHPDPYLRMSAAVALLQIDEKHSPAYAEVIKLLKSDDAELKERTLTTLKDNGFQTYEFLREAQKR
jgi:HEAT repeat protein